MNGLALDLAIVAQGLCCPLGLTAPTACAAMRADLAAFEELDYVDEEGEPIYGARVPVIADSRLEHRSIALLRRAIADLGRGVEPRELASWPAILITAHNHARTVRALAEVMPSPPVASFAGGPGTDLLALRDAATLLAAGTVNRVLICAVDCSITARTLYRLREAGRLRTPNNPQGVVPGEAAACLLLERAGRDRAGMIVALGVGEEPATFANDAPMRALGLTEAVRGALEAAGCELHDVDWRLATHGDEGLFVKEQSLMLARLLESPKPKLPIWQPAEYIGDVGVAAGFVQIIWATQAWARGYAPGSTALCMCSDPDGRRSAVLVRR